MITPFGKALRKIRIERDMVLKHMADFLGCSSAYLSSLELGKKPIPKKFVEKIGEHLGLSEEEKKELYRLAEISKPIVKISLQNSSDKHREVVIEFAQTFSDLSEANILELRKLLKKGKKSNDPKIEIPVRLRQS